MAILAFKGTAGSYDEVFTPDGALRAPYAELRRRLGVDVLRPTSAAVERLRDRPLGDDVRILPVPWALDGGAYASVVQAGVRQRALALQRFFADVAIGPSELVGRGAGLTPALLEAILELEGTSTEDLRALWAGHTREEIRFVYGPDLVRGPDGSWLVLEDNVGCVGGSADASMVWSLYADAVGTSAARLGPPEPDLCHAVGLWLDRLGVAVGDPGVLALAGCEAGGDGLRSVLVQENTRRRLVLEPLGLAMVESCQLGTPSRAIVNFEALSEPVDAAFRRGTPLFNAPGTGVLGNKALLPYVDEMIRFYCHEEPLVATPPTRVLVGGELPDEPEGWVVKSAAGSQGTEVFVLRPDPPERLEAVRDLVGTAWPKVWFVAQRHVEPSHLASGRPEAWETYLVELRPLTYVVGWSEVHVSAQPVGKAVSGFDVRRQHNISQGACYVPVAIVPEGGL